MGRRRGRRPCLQRGRQVWERPRLLKKFVTPGAAQGAKGEDPSPPNHTGRVLHIPRGVALRHRALVVRVPQVGWMWSICLMPGGVLLRQPHPPQGEEGTVRLMLLKAGRVLISSAPGGLSVGRARGPFLPALASTSRKPEPLAREAAQTSEVGLLTSLVGRFAQRRTRCGLLSRRPGSARCAGRRVRRRDPRARAARRSEWPPHGLPRTRLVSH